MKFQIKRKKLIRLLSVAIFFSLLFVGVVNVTPAQAEMLDGPVKSVAFCDDGFGNNTGVKEKVIDIASFDITQAGTLMTASIVTGGATFTMSGNTISKSPTAGVFQIFGNDGGTSDLAMNGKYKLNKAGTTLLKIAGIFQAQDLGDLCISAGKFKAVNLVP